MIYCIEGYYFGLEDKKNILIEGCSISENENKYLECEQYYCLDVKTGQCIYNDEIEDEEKKFNFRCNRANEEGTKCEACDENLILVKMNYILIMNIVWRKMKMDPVKNSKMIMKEFTV